MKRLMSMVLVLAMLLPALPSNTLAAEVEPDITIEASSGLNTITVAESTGEGGGESDPQESAPLILSVDGSQAIERDYDQKALVRVKNVSAQPVEYYLQSENDYSDIYMNFVKSGSEDAPLTIQPGETQTVELSIFAQNARRTLYSVPVYAVISDAETVMMNLTILCNYKEGSVTITQGEVNEHTLATEFVVTNNGSEDITDLTLAMGGDAEDYVRISPSVENYRLETGDSITVRLIPDLTKMKADNLSVVKGTLMALGGVSAELAVTFDTEGKEITSTTMGKLALKQDGNPYYDIETNLDKVDGTVYKEGQAVSLRDVAQEYLAEDNVGVNTQEEVDEVYAMMFDSDGMVNVSLESGYNCAEAEETVDMSMDITSEVYTGEVPAGGVSTSYEYDEAKGMAVMTTTVYVTQAEYDAIMAEFKSSVAAKFDLAVPVSAVALADEAEGEDHDKKIAISFTQTIFNEGTDRIGSDLKYIGKFTDGLQTASDGYNTTKVWINPNYSEQEKMNYTVIQGARVYMRHWGSAKIIGVMTTSLDGPGFILGCLTSALANYALDNILAEYEESMGAGYYDIYGSQCTNAGAVTSTFYLPDYGIDYSYAKVYETGRMYDGTPFGGNAGYAESQFGGNNYVHMQPVTYQYEINGENVGSSENAGLTQVDIVDLQGAGQYLKPGVNTIVRDYNTNAGHYKVTADTQITVLYPSDTPISFIGEPEDMEEVRQLSDFAVYTENITPVNKAIIGESNALTVYVYNRGSATGWVDITVNDGQVDLYKAENVEMKAFSEKMITIENWTPAAEENTVTVTLVNKGIGQDERKSDNNTASRVIAARNREVPVIGEVLPAEGLSALATRVTADLTQTADLKAVEVQVGETTLDAQLVNRGDSVRAAANAGLLPAGKYPVKVIAEYYTGVETTETVTKESTLTVSQSTAVTFTMDETVQKPNFYILKKVGEDLQYVNDDVTENNGAYTLIYSAEMEKEDGTYYLAVACDNGLILKPFSDINGEELSLEGGKEILVENGQAELQYAWFRAVNGMNFINLSVQVTNLAEKAKIVTVGVDSFDLELSLRVNYQNIYPYVEEAYGDADRVTIDLSQYYMVYGFQLMGLNADNYYYADVYFAIEQEDGRSSYRHISADVNEQDDGLYLDAFVTNTRALEELKTATSVTAYISLEDTLYVQPVGTVPTEKRIELDRSAHKKITITCAADDFYVGEISMQVGDWNVWFYANQIYVPAGSYPMIINYNVDQKNLTHACTADATTSDVTIQLPSAKESFAELQVMWPQWFGKNGYLDYEVIEIDDFYGSAGVDLKSGESVLLQEGERAFWLNIYGRDEDRSNTHRVYVEKRMELQKGTTTTWTVSDRYEGNLNVYGSHSYSAGEYLSFNLWDLQDTDGAILEDYYAYTEDYFLYGTVTLSDSDTGKSYEIPVVVSSLDDVNMQMPASVPAGSYTYSIKLTNVPVELPEADVCTITATAGKGGTIDPSGLVEVQLGEDVTFTVRPNAGYELQDVLVDGVSQGAVGTYTFASVSANHTIAATFREKEKAPEHIYVPEPDYEEEQEEERTELPFTDVNEDDWYYDAVAYAYENKLFSGTSNTTFSPNVSMTRGMMVTVLYNLSGETGSSKPDFADVPADQWYSEAVAWAAENGIVDGVGNGLFAPNSDVTREQMAVILYNYVMKMGIKLPYIRNAADFVDQSSISDWAEEAVTAMYCAGILNGRDDGSFDPQGQATRAEVAAMFMNFAEATNL